MDRTPLLSVIIPVYNTEKFLNQCLGSITGQTYQNLEIICVNDCTTDDSVAIIQSYQQRDARVRLVAHEKNRGLFQARLTGVEAATGEYIAFVDSDDYLTADFYRILMREAVKSQADMTVGNTVFEDENHWKYVEAISRNFTATRDILEGASIMQNMMEDEGLLFSWHTVWNKVYRKELWDQCMPHYKKITTHLIMTEDIAFSTVLYYYAKKMKFVNHDGYMYYRHSGASTGQVNTTAKLEKHISDLETAFCFVRDFLKEVDVYDTYETYYLNWRLRYFRWWSYHVKNLLAKPGGKLAQEHFLAAFEQTALVEAKESDGFFSSVRTGWQQSYEHIKTAILDDGIQYVSFDIFDTLVVRPLLEPTDVFCFMQNTFEELTHDTNLEFVKVRQMAERICRKNMAQSNAFFEDVTLSEIYDTLGEVYHLSKEVCMRLMEKEIALEVQFCTPRFAVKELYQLALEMGKKVIIISDMYLPQTAIEQILHKNGYTQYEKVFVSSEERVLKYSQRLFKHALKDLNIKNPSCVLHVGDTYPVDIEAAGKVGMKTAYVPKCKDVFLGKSGYKSSDDVNIFTKAIGMMSDTQDILKSLPARCMLAVVANKMFDNPFVSFHEQSDFNASAYYVGYYLLGMNMLGLTKWMLEDAKQKGYETIHFIARDGYLPKQVYDVLAAHYEDAPKSNYIYASRKSLVPTMVRKKEDLYMLAQHIGVEQQTPNMVLELLSCILSELTPEKRKQYQEKKILMDVRFQNLQQFNYFIDAVIELSYNQDKIDTYHAEVQSYFRTIIGEKDCTFDLGYSGKIQKMLNDLTQQKTSTYFLHGNGAQTTMLAQKAGFEVNTYYASKPALTGIMREYMVSDYGPSCIGYSVENGVTPKFEEESITYQERYILDDIFYGATEFATEFLQVFHDYLLEFHLPAYETSLPLERYLCHIKPVDKMMYGASYIEDTIYSGNTEMSLTECWDWHLSQKGMNGQNSGPSVLCTALPTGLEDLYADGLFVALYKKLNRLFPKGGKLRDILKRIAGVFLH